LYGDRIVAFAVPTPYELGLFFEVLYFGHIGLHDEIVQVGIALSATYRCMRHAPTAVSAAGWVVVN